MAPFTQISAMVEEMIADNTFLICWRPASWFHVSVGTVKTSVCTDGAGQVWHYVMSRPDASRIAVACC